MKLRIVVLMVLLSVTLCGCGKNQGKDENSSVKANDEFSKIIALSTREKMPFESLRHYFTVDKEENGNYYYMKVYMEDLKIVNVAVDVVLKDEESAVNYFTSIYNSKEITNAIMNGRLVSYVYKEGQCDYYNQDYVLLSTDLLNMGFNPLVYVTKDLNSEGNG